KIPPKISFPRENISPRRSQITTNIYIQPFSDTFTRKRIRNPDPSAAVMSDDSPPLSAASSPISSLPEHLIHHITSFLPPQSAAQLCLLSTRFLSAWKSTPYLSFENSSVDGDEKTTTRFLNYIQSTIARRARGFNLEIFRIKSSLRSDRHDVIDSVIDYAVDSGVLILDLELRYRFYSYYLLPPKILSCSSLTALYLTGFNLDPTQSLDGVLTITHPLLQDLKLCHCDKIHSLKLESCPRLKSLEIKSCVGLESLYIETETSNLESLDFAGTSVVKVHGVSNCPSIRRISISNLEPYLLTELVSKLPNLESIRLESVKSGWGTFELRHNNLKNAELNFDSQLFVGVKGHKLESISIRYNESQNSDDLIDLAGCESLRSLKLIRAGITNQWIEKNKLIFEKLELLELESCARLKNLKVHNDLLESLVVIGCDKLEKIELNAINLDKFHYDAGNAPIQLPGFVLCSSSRLLARVSLPNQMLINPARFGLSIQNLKSFGHCKLLHLHVSSVKVKFKSLG
ncbi:Putative F-box/FBD/LRR-repeat protein At4g03220, partial [Linum grandiflorum]